VTSHVIRIERRYVNEDADRHGNVRIYFWRGKGHLKVRILEKPGTEAFDSRYHELVHQSAAGAFKPPPRGTATPARSAGSAPSILHQLPSGGSTRLLRRPGVECLKRASRNRCIPARKSYSPIFP
jgi:hypothetical protein